jgi:hypothetical protein
MTALRERLLQRETALVAAALLLPIPLFALSGLTVPLPGAIERSIGSLVTLASDEGGSSGNQGSEATSTGPSPAAGRSEEPLADGSRRSALDGRAGVLDGQVSPGTVAGGDAQVSRDPGGDDGGGTPPGGGPEGASAEPGIPGDASGAGGEETLSGSEADATPEPRVSLRVAGQGASSGISAGTSGLDLETGADGGQSGEEPEIGVEVGGEDGARTEVEEILPAPGIAVP